MLKILTVISLVQFAAIVFLYSMLVEIDHKVTPTAAGGQNALVSHAGADDPFQAYSYDAYAYPDEERLRQIIREELGTSSGNGSAQYAAPATMYASVDPDEFERRREEVDQQLEYYASVGSISDTDMQKLQMNIARLDDAGRKEMLSKLTHAMNSGRLDGRF